MPAAADFLAAGLSTETCNGDNQRLWSRLALTTGCMILEDGCSSNPDEATV